MNIDWLVDCVDQANDRLIRSWWKESICNKHIDTHRKKHESGIGI